MAAARWRRRPDPRPLCVRRDGGRPDTNEETLLADGKEDVVRTYRLSFQETVKDIAMQAFAEITGRDVLTYHSQIVFHPMRAFEIFVLEPEPR